MAPEYGILAEIPGAGMRSRLQKKITWPSLENKCLFALLDALNKSIKREAGAIARLRLRVAHKCAIIKARWESLFQDDGVLLAPRAGTHPYRKIGLSPDAKEIFRSPPTQPGSPWIFPLRDLTGPVSDIFLFRKRIQTELRLEALSIRVADWRLRIGIAMPTQELSMSMDAMRNQKAHRQCARIRHEPLPA